MLCTKLVLYVIFRLCWITQFLVSAVESKGRKGWYRAHLIATCRLDNCLNPFIIMRFDFYQRVCKDQLKMSESHFFPSKVAVRWCSVTCLLWLRDDKMGSKKSAIAMLKSSFVTPRNNNITKGVPRFQLNSTPRHSLWKSMLHGHLNLDTN